MAITFVQGAEGHTGSSASAQTKAYPSSVTSGSLLVVVVATFNSGVTVTVSDSLNGSHTQAGSYSTHGSNSLSVWYFANSAGGACTVTVTPSGSAFVTIAVLEYSGAATATPLHSTVIGANNTTDANPLTGTCTASAGELVVGAYCQGSTTLASDSVAAPFTDRIGQLNGSSFEGLGVADDTAAAGSEGASFTTSAATSWAAMAASFKAGAGGGGGSTFAPMLPLLGVG